MPGSLLSKILKYISYIIYLKCILYYYYIYIEGKCECCSVMSDSVIPWTVASQAPLSMEFFRQKYWGR